MIAGAFLHAFSIPRRARLTMDRNVWNNLSCFQTNDFIRREYQKLHGGRINAGKTKEIISCFVQGQEYFRNAAAAAEAVRPLLLYYGVASLSVGTTLFLNCVAREATIPPQHGLHQKDWRQKFTQQNALLQLEVKKTTEGTFDALHQATENRLLMQVPAPDGGVTLANVKPPLGESSDNTYTFDDVLSRIPELYNLYFRVTQRQPNFILGEVMGDTTGATTVRFSSDTVAGITSEAELRSRFQLSDDLIVGAGMPGDSFPGPHFVVRLPPHEDGSWSRLCPQVEQRDPFGFTGKLIAPWPNGGYVSPLLRGFLASFFLGILVRYFPSCWMALIRNEKGDGVVPLLRATMDYVEEEFPRLAYSALTEHWL